MSLIRSTMAATAMLAGLATAAVAQGAFTPASKTFKDWEVGCDNLRGCVALGFLKDESANGYVRIALSAGPDAKPDLKVVIDGEEIADIRVLAPALEVGATGLAALLAAARKADRVTLADAKGSRKAEFSLAGAAAALLFIDDAQGRVGTTTALMRPGSKPASTVPPAPKPPLVKAVATSSFGSADEKLKSVLLKALPASAKQDCERMKGTANGEAGDAFAMNGGQTLVILPCDAGAYNFNSLAWLVGAAELNVVAFQPVRFPEPDGKTGKALTNADYDAATGEMSFFAKGRGIGDCGVAGTYAWTGRDFVLTSYRKMERCQGVESDDWPVLWRTTAAK